MKKFKFILILAVMIISANSFGQSNCNDAVPLTTFNSEQDYYLYNNEYWLSFKADSTILTLLLMPSSQSNATNITSINIYSGDCYNLVLESTINLLANDSIIYQSTQIGQLYKIQVISDGNDGYFAMNCSNTSRSGLQMVCSPTTCILNPNPNFSELSAYFLNNIANGINDPLADAPSYNWWTDCCNWVRWKESPQIKRELIAGTNYNYYLHMWARFDDLDNTDGIYNPIETFESAYNRINGPNVPNGVTLTQGNDYRLSLKYRPMGISSLDIYLIDQSEYQNLTLPPNINQGQLISTINISNSSTNWDDFNYIFNCNSSSFNSILLVPHRDTENTVNGVFTYTWIDIDDVVLIDAPIELPITLSWGKPCELNANFSFNMPSTPNIIYTWILPGNATITNSNPINNITVNWNNAGVATITVQGHDNTTGCLVYEGSLEVDPGSCPPVPAVYQINNLNATQIKGITGLMVASNVASSQLSISINGTIIINENLFFTSCTNVILGPMAKIIVMPGCTLSIANSNFSGCDCRWDGIFVEDPTAVLIIYNSFISGAKNAVVSSNKGKIHLFYSTFSNNFLGVWVRRYNPQTIDPFGNPYTPLPHNAYIAKCRFELGSLGGNNIGIKADTVYNLTIGDVNTANYTNEFYQLNNSIICNSSDVNIFNNYFNTSYNSTSVEPNYWNSEPSDAAIFIKRPYDPNPPQVNTYAIQNIVTIGGAATNQPNAFYLQNVGVYGFNTQVHVRNNAFAEQRFSAVHLRDLYNSDINFNSIAMQTSLSATNNLYNSSLLAEHTVASYQLKLNITNNTINNARTAIYTRNCNGTSLGYEYCNIAFNTINFEGLGTSAIPFIGINSSSCAYANIEQNTIQYNPTTTPNYVADYDKLKGISVATVQNAKVRKNILVRLGIGIWGADNLLGTQFFCNDLDKNYYGFYFLPGYANISDQVSSSAGGKIQASDNYWYDNSNFASSEMRRIGGDILVITRNWHHRLINYDINNIFSPYLISTHSLFGRILSQQSKPANADCSNQVSPVTSPKTREDVIGDIVKDSVSYQANPIENKYYAEDYAYKLIDNTPALLTMGVAEDSIYQNFYNENKVIGIGKFTDFNKKINNGEYADALQINNSIIPVNTIESQKKTVNNIYLQTIVNNQIISFSDSITLFNIANQLPFYGGEAVYSARVILGLDPTNLNLDYVKGPDKPNDNFINSNKVRVYPNPAINSINIVFETLIDKNAIFELYDFSGKQILNTTIKANTTFSTINLNEVKAGIYYYNLFTNNETLAKNKLVILNK